MKIAIHNTIIARMIHSQNKGISMNDAQEIANDMMAKASTLQNLTIFSDDKDLDKKMEGKGFSSILYDDDKMPTVEDGKEVAITLRSLEQDSNLIIEWYAALFDHVR